MIVSDAPSILVGRVGQLIWVRIEGRGSFQNSPALKEVCQRAMGSGISEVVVDLANCPVMDSTFMGTLAGAALKARQSRPPASLLVLNANERNTSLLRNLGLDQVFDVDHAGTRHAVLRREVESELLERASREPLSRQEQAAHVLEAHEALGRANEANVERFRDVVEFLKSEMAPPDPAP